MTEREGERQHLSIVPTYNCFYIGLSKKRITSNLNMSLFLRYMVTTGFDAKLRVWDIRQYKPVNCYSTYRPAPSVDISERGLVALGHDNHCEVRKMSSSLSL